MSVLCFVDLRSCPGKAPHPGGLNQQKCVLSPPGGQKPQIQVSQAALPSVLAAILASLGLRCHHSSPWLCGDTAFPLCVWVPMFLFYEDTVRLD